MFFFLKVELDILYSFMSLIKTEIFPFFITKLWIIRNKR